MSHANSHSTYTTTTQCTYTTTTQCQLTRYTRYHHTVSTHTVHTVPPYSVNSHSTHGTTIQCQLTRYTRYHHTVSTHTVHTVPPYIQCQLTQYTWYHHTVSTHTVHTVPPYIQCQLTQHIKHEEYCHTVARYQEILDCRVVSEDVLPDVERVVPVVSQQIRVFIPGQCKPCCTTFPGLLIPSARVHTSLTPTLSLFFFLFFGLPIRVAKNREGLRARFATLLLLSVVLKAN